MMKKLALLLLVTQVIIIPKVFSQGIGINSDGAMPVDGAILDVKSTTQGMLIPRMTEAQRDAISPDTQSMLIYQTNNDSGFYFYDGSAWMPFLIGGAAANSGWSTKGNAGTTVGTNFLGTTDAEDFAVYTNDTARLRISSAGKVGIGTTTPGSQFEVWGDFIPAIFSSTNSNAFKILLSDNGAARSYLGADVNRAFVVRDASDSNDLINILQGGNVGIGTASPDQKLEVEGGNVLITGSNSGASNISGLLINDAGANQIGFFGDGNSGNSDLYIQSYGTNNIQFYAGGSTRAFIDDGGNMGIATDSPQRKLHVNGVIRTDSYLEDVDGAGSGTLNMISASNVFHIDVGGTGHSTDRIHFGDLATADNNVTMLGNAGIGTANPLEKLHVVGADGNTVSTTHQVRISSSDNTSQYLELGYLYNAGTDSIGRIQVWGGSGVSNLGIQTAGGNVGIGTTSPLTPLHVNRSDGTTDFLTLRADRNSSDTEIGILFRDRNVVANSQQAARIWSERQGAAADFDLVFSTSDVGGADVLGEAMRIDHVGNVGIGTTNPTYKLHVNGRLKTDGNNETSDVRLKKDIQTIDQALEKLLQLRGVTYKWKTVEELKQEKLDPEQAPSNTNVTEVGLIAQELEAIIPEVVNTDVDGYKSVQYSKLVALLIEAIKEMETEKLNMQQRISVLEAKVNALGLPSENVTRK